MPQRGFYWLIKGNDDRGGLAGMPRPEEAELGRLPALGISLVVSLLESSYRSYRLPPGLRWSVSRSTTSTRPPTPTWS